MKDSKSTNENSNVVFIGFANNPMPVFSESKTRDWISFGADNQFPQHLLKLYNGSSNHNAIVTGKTFYIVGNGFPINPVVNRNGEKLNGILKKLALDVELFGGCKLECIWKNGGGLEIAHIPFNLVRVDKNERGFWYKKDWSKTYDCKPTFIPEFDINNRKGVQIFEFNEYRPGCDVYPLPGYFGALNDIETDLEISKYNLSIIKNGMFTSKMIVFNDGKPTKQVMAEIERDFKKKYIGSENGGNFMLVFNSDPAKAPKVEDLSSTNLDKLFDQLNKTTQSEIFAGHLVTSPMLFGIKTEGQLGGRSEMIESYEIFKNTYINGKQKQLEAIFGMLAPFIGVSEELLIDPVVPIAERINPVDFKELLPKEWVYEQLGIDPSQYASIANTVITDANATGNVTGTTTVNQAQQPVNDNIKNLTGRQYQQLRRIIREVSTGKLTREAATVLLKSSLALSDDDINTLLGQEKFDAAEDVITLFTEFGEDREDYVVIKSTSFKDSSKVSLSQTDADIVNMIRKDPKINEQSIAVATNQKPSYIKKRIETLEEAGVLKKVTTTVGIDTVIERAIVQENIAEMPKPETVNIEVRYEYGWRPEVPTSQRDTKAHPSRDFCRQLMSLKKIYTRTEIENISQRLGYSVFDRQGGWWGSNAHCRHQWNKIVVVKKNKNVA